jgi:thermopsin
MFARKYLLWAASLAVVAVLLLPAGALNLSGSARHPAAGAPTAAGSPSSLRSSGSIGPSAAQRASTEAGILASIHAAHVPSKYVYLPNFNAQETRTNGLVSPTYHHSPAPLGIAAMGLANTNGTMTGYVLNSQSFEGSITYNSLNAFYLDDDAADYLGAQLNTVVTNITLFGNSSNSFWNQNVVSYSGRSHLLQFIDNIWNFSSPAFYMSPNVFNATSPNGTLVAPSFYYAIGPVINITMPFTLHLFINTSVTMLNGSPYDKVYFNYTVIKGGAYVQGGGYDWAIFNSQIPGGAPIPTIPQPEYQVNGINVSPTGYLPYDAELVFCGPGGGSTTSIYDINASLNLWYLNGTSGRYQTVPSAFAYGTDTGETLEGATEWYDANNTVWVGPGPTLPDALWNASPTSHPGFLTISGTVTPSTSFVFLNQSSTFNATWSAWAPVPPSGTVAYQVPVANYTGEILMSNYDPTNISVNAASPPSWTIAGTLTPNNARGVYTPLIAFTNAQVADISSSGSGTAASPYQIMNNQVGSLDPIFGSFNDFTFPVFPGLLVAHTTVHVDINNSAPYYVAFGGRQLLTALALGMPTWNDLQTQLYGTTFVSLWNSTFTGWFFGPYLGGFPITSVMIWNSSSTLVGNDHFWSQGTSVLVYGGSANTIWGNWFEMSANLSNPSFQAIALNGFNAFGPEVYESGDRIYNNVFLTQIPAYSPASTIYTETFTPASNISWVDNWNISSQPATNVHLVNGYNLSGNILGGATQGGNLWWDFGQFGYFVPFNGNGLIAVGGDHYPLGGDALTFATVGLPLATFWGVTLSGLSLFAGTPSTSIALPDGAYNYTVLPPAGYTPSPASGNVTLVGSSATVVITFSPPPVLFNLTIVESGLPASTTWTASVNGVPMAGNTTSLVFPEPNGTYTWAVAPVAGRTLSPASGTVQIAGASQLVAVAFTAPAGATYAISFVQTTLPAGTAWSVTLAGTLVSSTLSTITFNEPNGTYPYTVGKVANYTASSTSGNATVKGLPQSIDITFAAAAGAITGTISPGTAQLWIDGNVVALGSGGTFSVPAAPGVHSVEATASGYAPYFNNVTVTAGTTLSLPIALYHGTGTTSTSSTTFNATSLALLAGLGLLALIFLVGMVYFWSRSRRPPMVMRAESTTTTAPGTATTTETTTKSEEP